MTEKYIVAPDLKIKREGIVDFYEVYRSTKKFLEDYGFCKDEQDLEEKYIERMKPRGKQLEIAWHGEKKVSSFFKYIIKVRFLVLGMNDVEVQQGNIKRKLQKGSFEIRIDAYIETSKSWDSISGLKRIYLNIIIPKRLEEYKLDLYDKTYKLQAFIKELMGIRD